MAEADVVARWNVPMSDKVYKIEFHHGTTTGKRIVKVNGKVSVQWQSFTSSVSLF